MENFDENFLESKNKNISKVTNIDVFLLGRLDFNNLCDTEKENYLQSCYGKISPQKILCEKLENALKLCLHKNEIM
jgi:hypothetical protein